MKSILEVSKLTIAGMLVTILLLLSCNSNDTSKDHPDLFNAAILKATTLTEEGQGERAIRYLDSTYKAYPTKGPGDLYQLYHFKAHYYLSRNNYRLATSYANNMLSVLKPYEKDDKYSLQHAEADLMNGDIMFSQELYSYAYQYYYLGKEIAETNKDNSQFSNYLSQFDQRLAMINYEQDDLNKAILYYKESLNNLHDTAGTFNYYYEKQGTLSNIAFSYIRLQVPDSALAYYDECLKFLTTSGADANLKEDFVAMAKGSIYGNMGDAYVMKDQYPVAASLYNTSILINSKKGYYNEDAMITQFKLAHLYLKEGKIKEAGAIIDKVSSTYNFDDPGSRLRLFKTFADYHQAAGNDKETVKYLLLYEQLKDSVQLYRSKLTSQNINSGLQVLQQEHDTKDLKEHDHRRNISLAETTVFTVMALLIILLIVQHDRTAKKHKKEGKTFYEQQEFTLLSREHSERDHAHMTHIWAQDLKQLLQPISAIIASLKDERPMSAEEAGKLELAERSVDDLTAMIDTMAAAGAQGGAITLTKRPTDITDLLKHSVALLQFKADEKDQTIHFKGKGHFNILIDRELVWKVINNLIINAIRSSPEHSSIYVGIKDMERSIQISVADAGQGVPPHLGNKIFDGSATNEDVNEDAYGPALHVSKQIVEAHGGKIWFEKGNRKGAIFYFTLPDRP